MIPAMDASESLLAGRGSGTWSVLPPHNLEFAGKRVKCEHADAFEEMMNFVSLGLVWDNLTAESEDVLYIRRESLVWMLLEGIYFPLCPTLASRWCAKYLTDLLCEGCEISYGMLVVNVPRLRNFTQAETEVL